MDVLGFGRFFIPVVISFSVGMIVAVAELSTRYFDAPRFLIKNYASWIYVAVNGLVAVLAFFVSVQLELKVSNVDMSNHLELLAVFMGFAGMTIMRSSVVNINVKGKEQELGLQKTVYLLLDWVDRLYDRQRSTYLVVNATPLVQAIPFEEVKCNILTTCIAAMENISPAESADLNKVANDLETSDSRNTLKSVQLGIKIAKLTGIPLLQEVVSQWKNASNGRELVSKVALIDELQNDILKPRGGTGR